MAETLDNLGVTEKNTGFKEGEKQLKDGFNITNIPDRTREALEAVNILLRPYIDKEGRPGVRVTFPSSYKGTGGEIGAPQVMINGVIEIDGDTKSLQFFGPTPFKTNTQVLQIKTTDINGKQFIANIEMPITLERQNNTEQNITTLLAPNMKDWQSIMNNIDLILSQISQKKITREQFALFQKAVQYGVEHRAGNDGREYYTGVRVLAFDGNFPNRMLVGYTENHPAWKNIIFELSSFTLQKGGPRYNELMQRLGIFSATQQTVDINSQNWQNFNLDDPFWLKPLPPK